jgi:hypothetical protein
MADDGIVRTIPNDGGHGRPVYRPPMPEKPRMTWMFLWGVVSMRDIYRWRLLSIMARY